MPLPPGHSLGPFQILGLLGQGGMGDVYKARDSRLDRIVAIKVSQAGFSERFHREAKVISSLNHPNICALFDIGSQDGLYYLVMEYLEGQPLQGPLPLDKLQRYGIEIAAALDAAHRKGVTHRDLKPDNIMVTASGIKLLDFGLAKTTEQPGPLDATVRKALTQEGVVMGTFPYMAPEQLEGKEADARTDIWAFGAVLYEMATGKRAFSGATQATVIANIMHVAPPPVTNAMPAMPAALDRIIRRALQKDPEERWQSARDLLIELRDLHTPADEPVKTASTRWRWVALGLGVVALIATGLSFRKPVSAQRIHMELVPRSDLRIGARVTRISPDGKKLLLHMGPAGAGPDLYIRHLDSPTLHRLEGTRTTLDAAWSPDSESVAYIARGQVQRIQADGTGRQTLAAVEHGEGIAWGDLGILVGQSDGPLLLIPPAGGVPVAVTQLDSDAKHTAHSGPYMLPDRKRFVFRVEGLDRRHEGIYLGSVGAPIRKIPIGLQGTRSFAGFTFFNNLESSGVARAVNWDKLAFAGESITIDNGLFPSLSENGTLAYSVRETTAGAGGLQIVNRSGSLIASYSHPDARSYTHPEFAPDGKRLLFESNGTLWTLDLQRKAFTRLNKEMFAGPGAWSADGRTIFFSARGIMWEVSAEGSDLQPLGSGVMHHLQLIGPRDMIGETSMGTYGGPLQQITFGPQRAVRIVMADASQDPQVSPDRKWLAYDRVVGDARAIFLQSWPDGKLNIPLPDGGGWCPRWRGDGKELFFLRSNGDLVSVAVIDRNDSLDFGRITPVMPEVPGRFAVSSDGQMFAYGTAGGEATTVVHVIVNWRGGK